MRSAAADPRTSAAVAIRRSKAPTSLSGRSRARARTTGMVYATTVTRLDRSGADPALPSPRKRAESLASDEDGTPQRVGIPEVSEKNAEIRQGREDTAGAPERGAWAGGA